MNGSVMIKCGLCISGSSSEPSTSFLFFSIFSYYMTSSLIISIIFRPVIVVGKGNSGSRLPNRGIYRSAAVHLSHKCDNLSIYLSIYLTSRIYTLPLPHQPQHQIYISIIFTPNLGFEIIILGRERKQGRFKESIIKEVRENINITSLYRIVSVKRKDLIISR